MSQRCPSPRKPSRPTSSRHRDNRNCVCLTSRAALFFLVLAAALTKKVSAQLCRTPRSLSSASPSLTCSPVWHSGGHSASRETTPGIQPRIVSQNTGADTAERISRKPFFRCTPTASGSVDNADTQKRELVRRVGPLRSSSFRVPENRSRTEEGPSFLSLASFRLIFPPFARVAPRPRCSRAGLSPDASGSRCTSSGFFLDGQNRADFRRTRHGAPSQTKLLSKLLLRSPGKVSSPQSQITDAENFVGSGSLSRSSCWTRRADTDMKLSAYTGGPSPGTAPPRDDRLVTRNSGAQEEEEEAALAKLPAALQQLLRSLRKLPANDPRSRLVLLYFHLHSLAAAWSRVASRIPQKWTQE